MKNLTLALNEDLLRAGRSYAQAHRTTLNHLVRDLLRKTTVRQNDDAWLNDAFALADRAAGNSKGRKWRREDLYER